MVTIDRLKKSHKKKPFRADFWAAIINHIRSSTAQYLYIPLPSFPFIFLPLFQSLPDLFPLRPMPSIESSDPLSPFIISLSYVNLLLLISNSFLSIFTLIFLHFHTFSFFFFFRALIEVEFSSFEETARYVLSLSVLYSIYLALLSHFYVSSSPVFICKSI
jgi:hypothetical protein